MDDRELEARLKARLNARFDESPVPTDLALAIRQGLAIRPGPFRFDTRTRGMWLGWTAVAAAAALALMVVLGPRIPGPAGPRDTGPATAVPEPLPTASTNRLFMVLSPRPLPSKEASSLAGDVLNARVQALGIGNFTSSIGNAIQFVIPAGGPSDATIREVLGATGDIRVVPLPTADYGPGKLSAKLGAPLPKVEAALFGWEGIASMSSVALDGAPLLAMTLKTPAAQAFADFAVAHAGETYAIVVDGIVALLPIAEQAGTDGSINLSNGQVPGGSEPAPAYFETVAILVGGELPEAWRGARAPVIVAERVAISAALGPFPGARYVSSDLDAQAIGDGWRAVWYVVISRDDLANQQLPCPTPGPSGSGCPTVGPTRRVVVNAENGAIIQIEFPPA